MVLRHDFRLDSDGIPLAASLFTPAEEGMHPALVICHGMPAGPRPEEGAAQSSADGELDYPALAEWCALEGFATLIFNFRGTGESGGDFHPLGWAHDLESVLTWITDRPGVDPARILLLGSSLGAAVAIYVAARRSDVAGIVSFASPSVMGPRQEPVLAVEHLREMGLIRDPAFPPSLEEWAKESQVLNPVDWVGRIAPRPLLLLHGDADDVVSPESVYTLFEHAIEPRDIQMLPGVGHRFRSEPGAIRVALDWLKQRFLLMP